MTIVLNSNAAATEASFNLGKSNANLRRSIARLSSGNRITRPTDDAGGLSVAYKLQSSMKRTEAALNNHQNALSYLQVQDGVLEVIGQVVDRMAELRTLAADVSKNAADVENYSKEFLELQDQLHQMKRQKFNGVELFATEEEWHDMQGVNKGHLHINGASYINDGSDTVAGRNAISLGTKEVYQHFDAPDEKDRTHAHYDKYEYQLYTHPSGSQKDGSIKLNIVNLQFVLGLKDPSAFGVDYSQTWEGQDFIKRFDPDGDNTITGAEWNDSWFDRDDDQLLDDLGPIPSYTASASEVDLVNNAYAGWEIETDGLTGQFIDAPGILSSNYKPDYEAYVDSYSGLTNWVETKQGWGFYHDGANITDYSKGEFGESHWGKHGIYEGRTLPQTFTGYNISISNTVNLAGLNQVTLDTGDGTTHPSNNGTDYASWLTEDGYIKDITKVSVEEFTNIIEKIADVRAENGAEQARVSQSLRLHQNNLVNLQAAHGRIMDVDVAMESTRLARHSVSVQAGAAMVAQANQMTAIALTLLSQ